MLEDPRKYDIIFCSNVLSAIPDGEARSQLLKSIHCKLKMDGKAIFITQYTNSFYSQLKNRDDVVEHLDGVITNGKSKATYYGILGKNKLKELLESHKFKIHKIWNKDQSTYAEVVLW